jgi:hypothetical protein
MALICRKLKPQQLTARISMRCSTANFLRGLAADDRGWLPTSRPFLWAAIMLSDRAKYALALEVQQVKTERDCLQRTVEEQHRDLAALRQEIAQMRAELASIHNLVHRRRCLEQAVKDRDREQPPQ